MDARKYKTILCETGVYERLFALKCKRKAKSMNEVLKALLAPGKATRGAN